MKPRTAVASYILAAVTTALANRTALARHAQGHKVKSHKALTSKQQARIDAIAAFYVDEITKTLRNTPFEGDTADVGDTSHDAPATAEADEPADDTSASNGAAQPTSTDQTEATSEFLGHVFSGMVGGAPHIVINVGGDLIVNRD